MIKIPFWQTKWGLRLTDSINSTQFSISLKSNVSFDIENSGKPYGVSTIFLYITGTYFTSKGMFLLVLLYSTYLIYKGWFDGY